MSNEPEHEEQAEISGGYVTDLEDVAFHETKHRAQTARLLAVTLVWILAGTIIVHYTVTACLSIAGKAEAVEGLNKVFNVWLPVISGLVGAATTYYFTRDRQ